jgi:hypothetical protein
MNARHLYIDELAHAAGRLLEEDRALVAGVNSRGLAAEARALERTCGGLSPHRFSHAWGCARQVTEERINGLVSSTVVAGAAPLHRSLGTRFMSPS